MEDDEVYIDVVSHAATLLFHQRKYGSLPQSSCVFNGKNYWEYIRDIDFGDMPRHQEFNPIYFDYLGLRDGEIPDSYSGGVYVDSAREWIDQCRLIINGQPAKLVEMYVIALEELFEKIGNELRIDEPVRIYESKSISELHLQAGLAKNLSLVYAILAMHTIAQSVMRDFAVWAWKTDEIYKYPYKKASAVRLVPVSQALAVARELLALSAVDQVVKGVILGRERDIERAKNNGASGGEARSEKFGILKNEAVVWVLQEHRAAGCSLAAASRRYISVVYSKKDSIDKILKPDSDHVRTVRKWVSDHLKTSK